MKRLVASNLDSLAVLPPLERAKYYIPATLRETIPIRDSGEPLVNQNSLEAMGIVCKPFWEDQAVHELVDEGEEFRKYLKSHSGFSLSVRQGAAKRLQVANQKLAPKYGLVLKAGYRPLEVQRGLFQAMYAQVSKKYPHWGEEKLLEYTRQFVADPNLLAPAHTTGGAIDVLLFDNQKQKYVDMGSAINHDGTESATFYSKITDQQKANRMLLLETMLDTGFANLPDEWWHFSYGDPTWAAFYNQPATIYSKIAG